MKHFIHIILLIVSANIGQAQELTDRDLVNSNNQIASLYSINLDNYYYPRLFDLPDLHINIFNLKVSIPIGGFLFSAIMPFNTVPENLEKSIAGTGDLHFFTTYLFNRSNPNNQIGLGVFSVFPTAQDELLGAGKWRIGATFDSFFSSNTTIQYGLSSAWQISVAGETDRVKVHVLSIQPLFILHLSKGFHLRSKPAWVFNLDAEAYNIPMGLGVGKLFKVKNILFNFFIEPQVSVLHNGSGHPVIQYYSGLNIQID